MDCFRIQKEKTLYEKLSILSDAAKYDVACTSSGTQRRGDGTGIGNCEKAGICHSFTPDGRCVSLLKILFTNECIFDCKYCINRASNDVERTSFTPDEVCRLTIEFYRRNYIEGLFLSSAVIRSPNYTMEMLIKTVSILRNEYKFNGRFPKYNDYYVDGTQKVYTDNIGCFSVGYAQIFVPDNEETTDNNNCRIFRPFFTLPKIIFNQMIEE